MCFSADSLLAVFVSYALRRLLTGSHESVSPVNPKHYWVIALFFLIRLTGLDQYKPMSVRRE